MKVKVAAIQATPAFFDIEETMKTIKTWILQSVEEGAQLVVFPESFIPGYPRGFTFEAVVGKRTAAGRDLYLKYFKNSLAIPSDEFYQLEAWSKEYNVYLMVGVTERDTISGSLYCSMVYFSPTAGYLGKHRKLKPTGLERFIWGEGDGSTLTTFNYCYWKNRRIDLLGKLYAAR